MNGTKAYRFSIKGFFKGFLADEDGAVTADYVVLTAAVCLLSVPVLVAIKNSTETATTEVAADMITNSDQ
jgi:Flp pilus assembly pilin Flp